MVTETRRIRKAGRGGVEVTGDIINEHNLQVTRKHVVDWKKNLTHICTISVHVLKSIWKVQPQQKTKTSLGENVLDCVTTSTKFQTPC